jgi:hypothetical protein
MKINVLHVLYRVAKNMKLILGKKPFTLSVKKTRCFRMEHGKDSCNPDKHLAWKL